MPGHVYLPDGRRVELTRHCVDRYVERWKPCLERRSMSEQFRLVAEDFQRTVDESGLVVTHAPSWWPEAPVLPDGGVYVHCGDLCAVVPAADERASLGKWVIATFTIRGSYPEDVRALINHQKSVRRAARRAANRKGSKHRKGAESRGYREQRGAL